MPLTQQTAIILIWPGNTFMVDKAKAIDRVWIKVDLLYTCVHSKLISSHMYNNNYNYYVVISTKGRQLQYMTFNFYFLLNHTLLLHFSSMHMQEEVTRCN